MGPLPAALLEAGVRPMQKKRGGKGNRRGKRTEERERPREQTREQAGERERERDFKPRDWV